MGAAALWVFIGGGLGSLARWGVSAWMARQFGLGFPLGTLFVNATGSFFIGLVAALTGPDGRWLAPFSSRQFMVAGLCGGYTTFSSFSLETLDLAQEGRWMTAALNATGSFVLCMLAVWLGHTIGMALNASKGR
ncbi:MAG: fluoride efflux transporter CrcB [Verrucomicrobia bacterium]|nr:fluoride efflux transporter CrcB [Verrucomicrobiota bacterium]